MGSRPVAFIASLEEKSCSEPSQGTRLQCGKLLDMKIGGNFERNWLSEESIIASCRHGEGWREREEEGGGRRSMCKREGSKDYIGEKNFF